MEYRIRNHRDCIACSKDGFLIKGFRSSEGASHIHAEIPLGEPMEGWIGIPHGGIGMGVVFELVEGLNNFPNDARACYPLGASFRLGGSRVRIGDTIGVVVSGRDQGAEAKILLSGEKDPYLTARVTYQSEVGELQNHIGSYLPSYHRALTDSVVVLPRYKHCLVCGYERRFVGLNRDFHLANGGLSKLVFSQAGFDPRDKDDFFQFRRDGFVHPLALISLLDETMGWAGFFIAGQGGVTVKLDVTFMRGIRIDEKLVTFGKPERKRGRSPKLMFFWSTGGIAAVGDDGALEIVASASAQYFALPDLTEQMKVHLLPVELTRRAFDLVAR